jgi:hypothetical protein
MACIARIACRTGIRTRPVHLWDKIDGNPTLHQRERLGKYVTVTIR